MTKKILTFNHHEPYISLLTKTAHHFDIVTRYKKLNLSWNSSSCAIPNNVKLVDYNSELEEKIKSGYYDVIICHTIKNLFWLKKSPKTKIIFIAHIPLFSYKAPLLIKSKCKKLIYNFFSLIYPINFVAVSKFKKQSWNKKGYTIDLAPQEFRKKQANLNSTKPILVANQLAHRKEELGYLLIKKISAKIPLQIIGNNPDITGTTKPKSFAEFEDLFLNASIYLYTIKQPYGDGYNTALLEAMSLGLAVVTVDNPSSPIKHNFNGLVGKNTEELIEHLKTLQNNKELRNRLGKEAQRTVDKKFSQDLFIHRWQETIEKTCSSS